MQELTCSVASRWRNCREKSGANHTYNATFTRLCRWQFLWQVRCGRWISGRSRFLRIGFSRRESVEQVMAALKRITSLTRALATATSASRPCFHRAAKKTYYTYVNEPSMPIPGKKPCWLKTADEAIEQAELDSGNRWWSVWSNKATRWYVADLQSFTVLRFHQLF